MELIEKLTNALILADVTLTAEPVSLKNPQGRRKHKIALALIREAIKDGINAKGA